ncbi:tetratricopeptide repeat protein [Roseivirga sp. E12]|uniref:tetratricopeptide repeat protein n=1 Tax=Roseivirga sp. E12 TaxID=2819237 RepID=UPI001ABC9B04|nr:tetratricopeptide repeat protein [Roseivirga sp. E12]MBO3699121.1 tetratricopeptide repeat protein [Roseivirga sp. E12]
MKKLRTPIITLISLFTFSLVTNAQEVIPKVNVISLTDTLDGASGNTLDPQGSLYQAQYYGNTITKINRYTKEVSEVAHEGLFGPVGLTFKNKDLYICNCNNNTIAKMGADQKVVEFAKSPLLNCPNGITLGSDGNLYVVNYRNPNIVKINPEGEATLFVKLPASSGGHIIHHRGNFYVTSFFDHKIFKVSSDAKVTHFAGTGTTGVKNGEALNAQFINPNGIVAGTGKLFVNDKIPGLNGRQQTVIRQINFTEYYDLIKGVAANGDLKAVKKTHNAYKSHEAYKNDHTEGTLNRIGYELLGTKQVTLAIGIFQINTESYPKSFNAWDSLAEAYLISGDKKKAKINYQKSLELNPNNTNAIEKLKSL